MSTEDIHKALQEAESYTPDHPLPLRRPMQPSRPYPIEALGEILGSAARRLHEVVKAPDAICGMSALSVAALVNQAHINVVLDGRIIPTSLFMLQSGQSGERKSGVERFALKAVKEKQKDLLLQYEIDKEETEDKQAEWQEKREEIRKNKGIDAFQKREALEALGPKPKMPGKKILLMPDLTIEGLQKQMDRGSPFVGVFSDEGGQLTGGHAFSQDRLLYTCASLSKAWDNGEVIRVRAKDDEPMVQYNRRVSLNLMVQDLVLAQLFSNPVLVNQGFLARNLVAAPETTMGTRLYEPIDLNEDPAMQRFWERSKELLEKPLVILPELNELEIRNVSLDPLAKNHWIAYHNHIEKALAPDGELESIRPFAAKIAEQALRIAGNIARYENPDLTTLTRDDMARGIEIAQYHIGEALRIFEARRVDPNIVLAERLLRWLFERNNPIITLTEAYQNFPVKAVRNAKDMSRLMGILEDHGWVSSISRKQMGNRAVNRWEVRLDVRF